MVMTIRISTTLRQHLIDLAAADPDREVCGLLLGRDCVIEQIVEAANVAVDPRRTFEIDARTQLAVMKAARGGGTPVMGCYHSHPSGLARPSGMDLELAETGSVWLIIAGTDLTAWVKHQLCFEPIGISH
jgi:proteasome lid subunit RPN8/RPN11